MVYMLPMRSTLRMSSFGSSGSSWFTALFCLAFTHQRRRRMAQFCIPSLKKIWSAPEIPALDTTISILLFGDEDSAILNMSSCSFHLVMSHFTNLTVLGVCQEALLGSVCTWYSLRVLRRDSFTRFLIDITQHNESSVQRLIHVPSSSDFSRVVSPTQP